MPGGDQIESAISRAESAAVEDAHNAIARDQRVERGEIAVAHHILTGARQTAQSPPQSSHPGRIDQMSASLDAECDPLVVICEDATTPLTVELAPAHIGGP